MRKNLRRARRRDAHPQIVGETREQACDCRPREFLRGADDFFAADQENHAAARRAPQPPSPVRLQSRRVPGTLGGRHEQIGRRTALLRRVPRNIRFRRPCTRRDYSALT